MNFLVRALAESDGNPSSMRLATFLIVGSLMAGWLYVTVHTGILQPLSAEQVGLVLGTLGVKAWQRGKETCLPPSH